MAAAASLTQNGYSLIVSSLITSVLGMLFWTVATRTFTQSEVGIGAGLIAAMAPLAAAAQFNFKHVLYRYVVSPGPRSRQLVLGIYLISATAAVVLGSGFSLLVAWIDPELADVFHSGWAAAAFVVALLVWTIYGLQEAVLVALRLSTWMPAKTLVYSAAKLVALFAFGTFAASGLTILAAWIVPALVIGLVTSAMLRLYGSGAEDAHDAPRYSRRELAGFVGWDYLGSLAGSLSFGMAPILVISAAGTVAGAHFYLAFSIAYVFYLVGSQMGAAMMAEHSNGQSNPRALYADAIVQTLLPVSAAAVAVVVLAPQIMQIFGDEFVHPGSLALQMLVLGAIPGAAITVFLAICRTKGWPRLVALVQTLHLVSALGLGYALSVMLGGVGMALALLVTETTIALGLAAWTLSRPNALPHLTVDFTLALGRILRRLQGFWHFLLSLYPRNAGIMLDGERWDFVSNRHASSGVTTLVLRRGRNQVVRKTGRSPSGNSALVSERNLLADLQCDARLLRFHSLLPQVLASAYDNDASSLWLTRPPGQDGWSLELLTPHTGIALQVAAQVAADLSRVTATPTLIDPEWCARWIDAPVAAVSEAVPRGNLVLRAMQAELTEHMAGRTIELGRCHGNFCLDNVLFEVPVGGRPQVSGIIDWKESRADSLPGFDVVFLILMAYARRDGRPFGQLVLDRLHHQSWAAEELGWIGPLSEDDAHLRALVLIVWLNYAKSKLEKAGRDRLARFWILHDIRLAVEGYDRESR